MKKTYKIEVDCANCANKMERLAGTVDGVSSLAINFMTQKLSVEFVDGADVDAVMKEILRVCRKVERDCEIHM